MNKLLKLYEVESDIKLYSEKLDRLERASFLNNFIDTSAVTRGYKLIIKSLTDLRKKLIKSLSTEERLIYEVGGYE